ncbi:MAG: hypothetical protein V3R82_02635 [Candidatus Hydrothermarchaeales archaeon]
MIVFDTSTLILLAKINLLDNILKSYNCIISKKVEEEATKKKELLDSKLITTRIESGSIKVESISSQSLAAKIKKDFNLGEGEVESIVLIKENKGKVLATDDGPTINACKILEIETISAPVFLVQACRNNEFTKEIAKEKLTKLEKYGRYNPQIIQDVRNRIGGE